MVTVAVSYCLRFPFLGCRVAGGVGVQWEKGAGNEAGDGLGMRPVDGTEEHQQTRSLGNNLEVSSITSILHYNMYYGSPIGCVMPRTIQNLPALTACPVPGDRCYHRQLDDIQTCDLALSDDEIVR